MQVQTLLANGHAIRMPVPQRYTSPPSLLQHPLLIYYKRSS